MCTQETIGEQKLSAVCNSADDYHCVVLHRIAQVVKQILRVVVSCSHR